MLATHLTESLDKADEDAADIAHTKVVDHMAEATTPTPVVTRAKVPVAEARAVGIRPPSTVEVEEAEIFAG